MKSFFSIIVFCLLFWTSYVVGQFAPLFLAKIRRDADDTSNKANEFDPRKVAEFTALNETSEYKPTFCRTPNYCCDPITKYRHLNGSCNNLGYPWMGTPNTTYSRLLPSRYAKDANGENRLPRVKHDGSPLPGARILRTTLFPAGTGVNRLWNTGSLAFGQLVAHDLSLLGEPPKQSACCTEDGKFVNTQNKYCFPIKIPPDDATMGVAGQTCMNFTRTLTDWDVTCGGRTFRTNARTMQKKPAQQINTVTSYLDLSPLYGMSPEKSRELRSFIGGKLKFQIINGHVYPPMETNQKATCPCNIPNNENICFKTGDSRANQNPQLAIMQAIFLREHNRIATELAKLNPCWNDEKLFQETRRILIAVYQGIAYIFYLPIFVGFAIMRNAKLSFRDPAYVNDYDRSINPSISNEFAHGAFRKFHTQIQDFASLFDSNLQLTGTVDIMPFFNRPGIITQGDNPEKIMEGMVLQPVGEIDYIFTPGITDRLFSCKKQFGIDLKATDIQRDRDHGLAYYNDYRAYCNLTVATSWTDYEDLGIFTKDNVTLLKSLYGEDNYNDVDLSVGIDLEPLAPGSQFGNVSLCIVLEQLTRTRKSDRFWFEHPEAGFTIPQLTEIKNQTYGRILCDNADGITQVPRLQFNVLSPTNQMRDCSTIYRMNLTLWKDPKCARCTR